MLEIAATTTGRYEPTWGIDPRRRALDDLHHRTPQHLLGGALEFHHDAFTTDATGRQHHSAIGVAPENHSPCHGPLEADLDPRFGLGSLYLGAV